MGEGASAKGGLIRPNTIIVWSKRRDLNSPAPSPQSQMPSVPMSAFGPKQTCRKAARMSASEGSADIARSERSGFMSTRPSFGGPYRKLLFKAPKKPFHFRGRQSLIRSVPVTFSASWRGCPLIRRERGPGETPSPLCEGGVPTALIQQRAAFHIFFAEETRNCSLPVASAVAKAPVLFALACVPASRLRR